MNLSIFKIKAEHSVLLKVFTILLVLSSCANKGSTTGYYKVGMPYTIDGKVYEPREQPDYDEVGIASWYGSDFHNKQTANGGTFNKHALTAAHRTLPLPSMVRVTNIENNKTLIVMVNDRGPFSKSRILDVSEQAAEILGFKSKGTAKVRVQYLPGQTKRLLADLPSAKGKVDLDALSKMPEPKLIAASDTKEIQSNVVSSAATSNKVTDATSSVVPEVTITPEAPKPSTAIKEKTKSSAKKTTPKKENVEKTEVVSKETATKETAPIENAKAAAKPEATTPAAPAEKIEEFSGDVYFIQAGTYSVVENATRTEKKLASLGSVKIVPINIKGKTFHKVKIGPIIDKKVANLTLNKVITLGHPDAIITKE